MELGQKAEQRARQEFSHEVMAERLVQFYHSV